MKHPENKRFYGSVTVGERGQMVIPAQARKDFAIKPGDKLLVFGDLSQGLGIATMAIMQKAMADASYLFSEVDSSLKPPKKKSPRGDNK